MSRAGAGRAYRDGQYVGDVLDVEWKMELAPPEIGERQRRFYEQCLTPGAVHDYAEFARRYGLKVTSGLRGTSRREEQGMDMKVQAPRNPYRGTQGVANDGEYVDLFRAGVQERDGRRFDGKGGVGLNAQDIDVMVRQHHRDGFDAGKRSVEPEVASLRQAQAGIYDEGYADGRIERASNLAVSLHNQLCGELLGPLDESLKAEKRSRAKIREDQLRSRERLLLILGSLREIIGAENVALLLALDGEIDVKP